MSRNQCEAVIHLNRVYRPRRQTGRGFLSGTVFLDAALLIVAFVLATASFVETPGIMLDLPVAGQVQGIHAGDMILSIRNDGLTFFNDQPVDPEALLPALRAGLREHPGAALILEADQTLPQSTAMAIYDAAAEAGFLHVFIATRPDQ